MVQKWFNEAVEHGVLIYSANGSDSIFYKGFKITRNDSEYWIKDVRSNDFYTEITEEQQNELEEKGFIRAADDMSYRRNCKRVKEFTKDLEKLYTKRDEYIKKKMTADKKYTNCVDAIYKCIDLLFFYKAKKVQHEQKWKLTEDNAG